MVALEIQLRRVTNLYSKIGTHVQNSSSCARRYKCRHGSKIRFSISISSRFGSTAGLSPAVHSLYDLSFKTDRPGRPLLIEVQFFRFHWQTRRYFTHGHPFRPESRNLESCSRNNVLSSSTNVLSTLPQREFSTRPAQCRRALGCRAWRLCSLSRPPPLGLLIIGIRQLLQGTGSQAPNRDIW
jgi:hypothetical protein